MERRSLYLLVILVILTFLTFANSKNPLCRKSYQLCGENKCCCKNNIALCRNHGTKLTYIPKIPEEITNLTFKNNYLSYVENRTFHNISNLNISELHLDKCRISNIADDAFVMFRFIRKLSLDGNYNVDYLQLSLSFNSIKTSSSLEISLRKLGLSEISGWFFQNLHLYNHVNLYLDENHLTILDMAAFDNLNTLNTVSANNNNIRAIYLGSGHKNVSQLHLSGNQLAREWPDFCPNERQISLFPKIEIIDFSNNIINEIPKTSLKCLTQLKHINLNNNHIELIKANTFSNLHRLKQVDLSFMNGYIKNIKQYAFNNSNLEVLNLEDNGLRFESSAKRTIFRACSNLKQLGISRNSFKNVNSEDFIQTFVSLQSLEKLSANECNITQIPRNFLSMLPNLKNLNLDGNRLSSLDNLLELSSNLTRLSVQSNNLHILNKHDFPSNFHPKNEVSLNIGLNPLECTCDMLWFRTAIGDTGRIGNIKLVNLDKTLCESPYSLRHTTFMSYHPSKSACEKVLLIAATSGFGFLICVIVSMVLAYKYRWYISFWIYKSKLKKRDPENQPLLNQDYLSFDGYVIYHSNDGPFVHHNLRSLVEQNMGYSLKIWERDADLGGFKVEEMVDSIHSCGTVLAVISQSSLNDEWVRFQINVALDRQVELKRSFLVLILLEDIDYQRMSKYWCVMLTKQKAAYWCADDADIRKRVFEEQISKYIGNGRLQNIC